MDGLLKRKPKEAFDRWRKYVQAVNNKEILDGVRSQRLLVVLNNVAKRTLRDATQRIFGEGNMVKGAIRKIYNTMLRMPRTAIDQWKKYVERCKRKDFFDNLRSAKLLNCLTRIPTRTTRDASLRILGGGNKIAGALKNILNGLKNIPRNALRTWAKYVEDVKAKRLYDGARSYKLQNTLERLQRRTMKEAADRCIGFIFAAPKIKAIMKRMDGILKRKPKEAFDRWRKYVQAVNNKEILDGVRSQRLLVVLNNVAKRTLRDATQRIFGEGNMVKGAIRKIYSTMLRMPRTAIDQWKKYVERCKRKDFFDNLRSAKLVNCLTRIPTRTTRDASLRILGGGNKIAGALKNILNGLKNIPRNALRTWAKYVEDVKAKRLYDGARSYKLQNTLERLQRRTMKEAADRCIGFIFAAPKIKAIIKRMDGILKRKPKEAFDRWRKYVQAVNNKEILDGVRSQRLLVVLTNVAKRTLRDATQRIFGEGNMVKGAIRKIYNTMLRMPRTAIDQWKKYVERCKRKDFFDNLRSAKLLNCLTRIPTRTARDASLRIIGGGNKIAGALKNILNGLKNIPRNALKTWVKYVEDVKAKRLYDGARSYKLQISLERLQRRTMKEAADRCIGFIFAAPKIKAILKRMDGLLKRKPKEAFDRWRKYVQAVNNKEILDSVRSQRLLIVLTNVSKRTLRDATQRMFGEGSVVKGAIRKIYNTMLRMPKTAVDKWKKYVEGCKHKDFFDNLRSAKLLNCLTRIPMRTSRDTTQRILGGGNKVKGCLENIVTGLKSIPKKALRKWVKVVQDIKDKKLFDNARCYKLQISLERIHRRTMKEAADRCVGFIFAAPKVRATIKRMDGILKRKPKEAFDRWRKYVQAVNNKEILDGVRSQRLLIVLTNVAKRTLRDATQRIFGEGNMVKGAIRKIYSTMLRMPRTAVEKWKKYVESCKRKDFFDSLRSAKLLNCLSRIPTRATRDATQRIFGGGNKVKGCLENIVTGLKNIPKNALRKWVKVVQDIKDKKLFDNARTFKLQIAIERLERRTLKEATDRCIGFIFAAPKVKECIRNIEIILRRKPKEAVDMWKKFVADIRDKKLLDGVRTHKLHAALTAVPRRTLRDAYQRIIGEGDKVKGALKNIVNAFAKMTKRGLIQWKHYVYLCNHKGIMDNLRSERLKIALSKIHLRTMKDVHERIVGEGDKVKGALRRIAMAGQKMPKIAFEIWRKYIVAVKSKSVYDLVRSHKLLISFSRLTNRTLKDANNRILGEGDKIKGAIRRIIIQLNKNTRVAYNSWKDFVKAVNDKNIFDNERAGKLQRALERVPRRVLKLSSNRILGEGNQALGALRRLAISCNKLPKKAIEKWREFITGCRHGHLMDNIRSQKLKYALTSIPRRVSFDIFDRLVRSEERLRGKLNNLAKVMSKKPLRSCNQWRAQTKVTKMMTSYRAGRLRHSLWKLPLSVLRISMTRIIGDGSRALGALRLLGSTALNRPREAFKLWKDFIERNKRGELFSGMRSHRLFITMTRISMRTMREAARTVITAQDKIKHMFRLWEVEIYNNMRGIWGEWRHFVSGVKRGELLDAVKTQKLRKAIEAVPRRTMRDAFERVIGDGSRVKGALRRLEISCSRIMNSSFFIWRDYMIQNRSRESLRRLKAQQLKNTLQHIPQRVLKDALDRILGDGKKVLGCLRRLSIFVIAQQRDGFLKWKNKTVSNRSGNMSRGNKIRFALEAIAKRSLKSALYKVLGDLRAKRGIARMTRNLVNQQRNAIERLRDRVMKLRMIKKVNAAYILMRMLKIKCDMMIKGRFRMWKNMEALRRMRLMRKALMHMLFYASINFENAFWKWKYVLTIKGIDVNPKHAVMQKRLSNVAFNYQTRLKQFALFKLLLFFRSNAVPQQSKKTLQFAVSSLVKATREEFPRSPSPERRPETKTPTSLQGSISRDAAGKLSKDELVGVNQLGAAEVVCMQLRNLRQRNLLLGFTSVAVFSKQIGIFDDERSRLIEQINELRYDKHSLLEDNTALRHHNEALIDNLEKTNLNFQSLSLHLDQMRLGRMVRVISKMIELPMLEALIMVKHHTGIN
ncbi:hypothetical protein SteCoe_8740 [Stentor coeruleus]|uniref:Uncharacterized protein n=1 Tax=Stentor coeruleus TaxID=5963 RepID=A0A1R2CJJ8_9CILI|nr:hypothetical protein SteCoe_8740 [Stentor coeruleus]